LAQLGLSYRDGSARSLTTEPPFPYLGGRAGFLRRAAIHNGRATKPRNRPARWPRWWRNS